MSLKGRIAIVTGTSAGIGLAVVRDLIAQGACVVGNGRRVEKLEQTAAELASDNFTFEVGDASDQEVIERLFVRARTKFGRNADIVISNAGRGLAGSVLSADLSQLEAMVQTNLVGAIRLLRRAGEELLKDPMPNAARDIIVLGSTVGRHHSPFSAVYGSTKFAINSVAESFRREMGPQGVRVSLIEPGIVESEFQTVAGYNVEWQQNFMNKFAPVLKPDDVARVISFIISQPPHVHINDVMLRPTRQDYP